MNDNVVNLNAERAHADGGASAWTTKDLIEKLHNGLQSGTLTAKYSLVVVVDESGQLHTLRAGLSRTEEHALCSLLARESLDNCWSKE